MYKVVTRLWACFTGLCITEIALFCVSNSNSKMPNCVSTSRRWHNGSRDDVINSMTSLIVFLIYRASCCVQYIAVCIRHNRNVARSHRVVLPLQTILITGKYVNCIANATCHLVENITAYI